MCTYAPGKDACQSDSGGPLYYFERGIGRLLQVGAISYGLACATAKPGVNVRVSSHLAWIVSVTSGKLVVDYVNLFKTLISLLFSDATYCIK